MHWPKEPPKLTGFPEVRGELELPAQYTEQAMAAGGFGVCGENFLKRDSLRGTRVSVDAIGARVVTIFLYYTAIDYNAMLCFVILHYTRLYDTTILLCFIYADYTIRYYIS